MNIAILIGISKYKSEAPLPACSLDVENMARLLTTTKKYDDIQLIHEKTNASQVKDMLRDFFSKYQSSGEIEEALVYFSGHGTYQNDAMFCCSDFDSNRPSTTSISNGELDDLLRSVKPKVAVKIIDACQSGSPYIKDANAGFEKALSKSSIDSFICMASSRQDQQSYASSSESVFTSKWIEAALSKDDGSILYRDIQAALADAFVSNPDQTPFFVNQGTGLEVFSFVTEEMKKLKEARIKTISPEKTDKAITQILEDEIVKRDLEFVPREEVDKALETSKELLNSQNITDPIVKHFFTKSTKTDMKLVSIPKVREVASFAKEQSWSKRYFVKINNEEYKVKVPKDYVLSLTRRITGNHSEEDYTIETRVRPNSIEITDSLPFEVVELSYISQHPSLPAFLVYLGVVHSLTEVMVLSTTVRLVQKGWGTRAPELSDVNWRYQSYSWRSISNNPSLIWTEAIQRGEEDMRNYLESCLPKPSPPVEDENVDSTKNDEKDEPTAQ